MKALLFAIHKEHAVKIFAGEKRREVRKTVAGNIKYPCEAFVYESKKNGGAGAVVGRFTCNGYTRTNIVDVFGCMAQVAALSKTQLIKYADGKQLVFYDIQNAQKFADPLPLSAFGLTAAPQSWQYIETEALEPLLGQNTKEV